MKASDDHSIFAWAATTKWVRGRAIDDKRSKRGLLARSPAEFIHSGDVCCVEYFRTFPYSTTNQGICLQLPLIPLKQEDPVGIFDDEDKLDLDNRFLAILNCQAPNWDGPLGTFLQRDQRESFVRACPDKFYLSHENRSAETQVKTIYIKERIPTPFRIGERSSRGDHYFFIKPIRVKGHRFNCVAAIRASQWSFESRNFEELIDTSICLFNGISLVFMFENFTGEKFAVLLGIYQYDIWSDVITILEFDKWTGKGTISTP
ncbi:MAG: hypothetical protein MMC33_009128 [Icmadophila ericetorum]|nr:hypothetical protein [Icmadophila ericetorum]